MRRQALQTNKARLHQVNVYVPKIPVGVDAKEIRKLFAEFGEIEHMKVGYSYRMRAEYCIVTYQKEESAQELIERKEIQVGDKGNKIQVLRYGRECDGQQVPEQRDQEKKVSNYNHKEQEQDIVECEVTPTEPNHGSNQQNKASSITRPREKLQRQRQREEDDLKLFSEYDRLRKRTHQERQMKSYHREGIYNRERRLRNKREVQYRKRQRLEEDPYECTDYALQDYYETPPYYETTKRMRRRRGPRARRPRLNEYYDYEEDPRDYDYPVERYYHPRYPTSRHPASRGSYKDSSYYYSYGDDFEEGDGSWGPYRNYEGGYDYHQYQDKYYSDQEYSNGDNEGHYDWDDYGEEYPEEGYYSYHEDDYDPFEEDDEWYIRAKNFPKHLVRGRDRIDYEEKQRWRRVREIKNGEVDPGYDFFGRAFHKSSKRRPKTLIEKEDDSVEQDQQLDGFPGSRDFPSQNNRRENIPNGPSYLKRDKEASLGEHGSNVRTRSKPSNNSNNNSNGREENQEQQGSLDERVLDEEGIRVPSNNHLAAGSRVKREEARARLIRNPIDFKSKLHSGSDSDSLIEAYGRSEMIEENHEDWLNVRINPIDWAIYEEE